LNHHEGIRNMIATVADIIGVMKTIAPPHLAEEWDNPGLQIGRKNRPVKRVWIALDPLTEVVETACCRHIDLLITHHPLIFKPIRSIDLNTPLGRIVQLAVSHQLAVFSAHTNLDSAPDGLNDMLSQKIGLRRLRPLCPGKNSGLCRLDLTFSSRYQQEVHRLLNMSASEMPAVKKWRMIPAFENGMGIQDFDSVDTTHKTIRVESIVAESDIRTVTDKLKQIMPPDGLTYEAYPVGLSEKRYGLGRIGELETSVCLDEFARHIQRILDLPVVRVAGTPDMRVDSVAVCSGSGSSLMSRFFSSEAQVYVSGDMGYHDARAVEESGRGLIDLGHFHSEHLVVDMLVRVLRDKLSNAGFDTIVEACPCEKDPFRFLRQME